MTDDYDEVKDSGSCRLVSRNRSRSDTSVTLLVAIFNSSLLLLSHTWTNRTSGRHQHVCTHTVCACVGACVGVCRCVHACVGVCRCVHACVCVGGVLSMYLYSFTMSK